MHGAHVRPSTTRAAAVVETVCAVLIVLAVYAGTPAESVAVALAFVLAPLVVAVAGGWQHPPYQNLAWKGAMLVLLSYRVRLSGPPRVIDQIIGWLYVPGLVFFAVGLLSTVVTYAAVRWHWRL